MKEEDHFTQTLLSLLSHCCTRQQGRCPWQLLLFLSCSLFSALHSLHHVAAHAATAMAAGLLSLAALLCSSLSLSLVVLLSWCLFIGKNGATNSGSSSTMVAAKL
jgi:hypothetical protein